MSRLSNGSSFWSTPIQDYVQTLSEIQKVETYFISILQLDKRLSPEHKDNRGQRKEQANLILLLVTKANDDHRDHLRIQGELFVSATTEEQNVQYITFMFMYMDNSAG